jgi:hypothetical protein
MFRKLDSTHNLDTLIRWRIRQVVMRSIGLLLISLVVFWHVEASGAASTPKQAFLSEECQATLAVLNSEEDWLEHLIDPVITSTDELIERHQLYTRVHDCLEAEYDTLPDDLVMVHRLTEYFLIFAAGFETQEDASTLTIVDLTSVDMPAIHQLREQAGLPPPEGYVFLRYYDSRESMPELVRRAFQNEDVMGVTIFSRYIAILEEDKAILQEQILQQQTLPETVAHELVHAYINATLGYKNAASFPRWFHEGVAIYLSGSGEVQVVMLGDLTVTKTSPEDYAQFDLNFKYLESEYGRDELLTRIGTAINEIKPTMLYEELGHQDEQALVEAAKNWRGRGIRNRLIGGIMIALFLMIGLWKVIAPEVKCPYCDYGGRRKAFENGVCPQCGRVVHL